ncbi:MAG: hypothetical protein QM758_29355 [Armatimonas sp.]
MSWLDTPLPPAERDSLLDTLANGLKQRGLAIPALFALELNRPLGNTLAHGLMGLTPLLAPVLGAARLQQASALLADPTAIDELIERLNEMPPSVPPPPPSVSGQAGTEGPQETAS